MRIILASSSQSRKQQLENLGVKFTAIAPEFDEIAYTNAHPAPPEKMALHLGFEKAKKVAADHPQDLVIGSDQMLVCHGEILGKGISVAGTVENLRKISGRDHQLLTSLVVITPHKTFQHLETVSVRMRTLSDQVIKDYIELDQPLNCAGGYRFEGAGAALMESVTARDPSSILGLPLMTLTAIFLEIGLGFPFQRKHL